MNDSPLLIVILEIPRGAWPIRGHVTLGEAGPRPFWGWAELRSIVYEVMGRRDSAGTCLTETESRIVSLVCEGLSSPDIAQLLVISPRTVQGHLYRVFKWACSPELSLSPNGSSEPPRLGTYRKRTYPAGMRPIRVISLAGAHPQSTNQTRHANR